MDIISLMPYLYAHIGKHDDTHGSSSNKLLHGNSHTKAPTGRENMVHIGSILMIPS